MNPSNIPPSIGAPNSPPPPFLERSCYRRCFANTKPPDEHIARTIVLPAQLPLAPSVDALPAKKIDELMNNPALVIVATLNARSTSASDLVVVILLCQYSCFVLGVVAWRLVRGCFGSEW
jgi:hypothetical protein